VCADNSDECDRLSVEDYSLPRLTGVGCLVDDARPVLLIVGHVDVVAVTTTVTVPQ